MILFLEVLKEFLDGKARLSNDVEDGASGQLSAMHGNDDRPAEAFSREDEMATRLALDNKACPLERADDLVCS